MPFIRRPEGFSSEALALLDSAMTHIWREHLATGASAPASNGAEDQPRLAKPLEHAMPSHKYKAGQDVYYNPPKGGVLAAAKYKIQRTLPIENGELKYRIKSTGENFERVARESELSRSR